MQQFWLVSRQQWLRLAQQWQEQARLRLACWLVLALLVANLVALCADWAQARQEDYVRALVDLQKMRELAGQSYWPERAVQAEDRLSRLQERLWQARDESLARADVQAWLDAEVKKAGLQESRINVLPPLDFESGKADARIEVQLRGRFDAASFAKLLYAVEGSQHWISIDALEVNNGLSPAINVQLSFHFLPPREQ